MLTDIDIKHFILVETLHLDFHTGLHVLTGETGAGKSILFDAIHLGLGARLQNHQWPQDNKTTTIALNFDVEKLPDAIEWLKAHDFPLEEHQCLIRRQINPDGKSRVYINDIPCQLSKLKELSSLLLQAHGQHQHHQLLIGKIQQQYLDQYAGHETFLTELSSLHEQYHNLEKKRLLLEQQADRQDSDLGLWTYQLEELQRTAPQTNEWEDLQQEHRQLHQSQRLLKTLEDVMQAIAPDNGQAPSQALEHALYQLKALPPQEESLKNIQVLLEEALIHTQEADVALRHYHNQLDLSPERLCEVEERLSKLHDLARKHRVNPADLSQIEQDLSEKIEALKQVGDQLRLAQAQQKTLKDQYQKIAQSLSDSRQQAASRLNVAIEACLQDMHLPASRFNIQLTPKPAGLHPSGSESVSFYFSANPGQALAPLEEVASGGELSRLSLAIFTVISTASSAFSPRIFLFDEIDAGISGKTADIVGRLLRRLSQQTQILCISHLPQVVAQAHHHYGVEKQSHETHAQTQIQKLSEEDRLRAIARLLAGEHITEAALENAKDMVKASLES